MSMRVFVPRFFDASNHNAQNLNAKAILSHAKAASDMQFFGVYYNDPVELPGNVRLTRLWRGILFKLHMVLLYQGRYDAIFYPGKEWYDRLGLKLRRLTGRRIPVIATMEGIPGDAAREAQLEKVAGHKVFCNRLDVEQVANFDAVRHMADHIIAISPFLSSVADFLYGKKSSVIPLGIDSQIFYPNDSKVPSERPTVICSGTVYPTKRPELFLALAEAIPNADFVWYGSGRGALLDELRHSIQEKGLTNIEFAGAVDHQQLAEAFRSADLFVLPSLSEGVPKVSQEAAACGLPLVMFGYYEAPTVVHGENGYVVWSDADFFRIVLTLVKDKQLRLAMGKRSVLMAENWCWNIISKRWLEQVKIFMRLQQ